MKRMTPKVLKRLENIQNNIQITIYLPLLPGPENTAKNLSALHHAVALLRKTFSNEEIPQENQQSIAGHITKLEQELSHPMSGKSLAIFITDFNQMLVYEASFAIETAIYFMAPNMQLEPLKAHYRENAAYWVLMLSQKGCTLMRGKGTTLQPIKALDISLDLKTALNLDETEQEIQSHAVGLQSGRVNEGFHGHGGFKDLRKKYMENYLRLIDHRLQKYVKLDTSPIYLVGLIPTQQVFKKVSRRKNIMPTHVSINAHHQHLQAIRDALLPQIHQQAV